MEYIVDRIEERFIVLEDEDGNRHNISAALLPDAHDGDVVQIYIDEEATNTRKNRIESLFNKLLK